MTSERSNVYRYLHLPDDTTPTGVERFSMIHFQQTCYPSGIILVVDSIVGAILCGCPIYIFGKLEMGSHIGH